MTAILGGADRSIWIVSIGALCGSTLSPPISQAADYWGRKWFVVGFTICGAVGTLIASRSQTFGQLIAGQVIACCAFGAQPLCHAIASEILPRKYRSLAQGACNTAAALGGGTGLLVGGGLVRTNPENFRTFFYITTALYAGAAFIIFWLYNPPLRALQRSLTLSQKLGRLDWIGYALFMPGLILFSFALTSSSGMYAWKSVKVIAPLVVGCLMLVAFGIYEWRFTREGMFHHDLFRGRNFVIAESALFAEGLVFFATTAYYGFEIVVLFDQDLFSGGAYFSLGFLVMILATNLTGVYCSRTKTVRLPLVLSFVSFTIFCAAMASVNPSMRRNALGYTPFFGLALGTALNAIVTVAQLSTPPDLISITTGLMISTRSVGGTVGLAIFSAVFSGTLNRELPEKVLLATVPLGLDPAYLGMLLGGLTTSNSTLLNAIPGVTPGILQAGGVAIKEAYTLGFRYVWITAMAFAVTGVIGKHYPLPFA